MQREEARAAKLTVWAVRGAPHFVRREYLADLQIALSPFSEADATKRILLAGKGLQAAGVGAIEGMQVFATVMREAVPSRGATISKGELSTLLHERLPGEYQVDCRRCGATHPHEQLFRIGALHAGLELEPGTNPPNLRRIPNWPRREPGFASDPLRASTPRQVIRAYLHHLGPASPRDIAAYLETNVGEIKAYWPADAREVTVAGRRLFALTADVEQLRDAGRVDAPQLRLLSGFDLFMAAKDREFLVLDEGHRKTLWPVLGRPGAVGVDGEVIGV
ncbi:DNA glycosylase AlkZ-like family protein [Gulosibacter chungangensis]|uniref:Winged helix DNA-binding domain-containing protein n=1 Tax=Gulosibacter chungangensis TaxID=979746 RepID=A0A7J5B951_9MICO|nr:crosslink repair DNA glycosylase YcaQ family protein [Gulosibacter chungangensis]KAB1642141.1 winged helix DNA-binding domain-containing protein [Gulosibacter chungangensis]